MMAEESKPKWEGKATVELGGISGEQVWPLLEDFCNLHKLLPIDTCYQVEGVSGQPGLFRYCAKKVVNGDETTVNWAKEKLLKMDPIQRCLVYEVVENNMGFKSYVATLKVLPNNGDEGSKIEWGFVSDPVQGWTCQDLNSHIHSSLQFMAKKTQLACSASTSQ